MTDPETSEPTSPRTIRGMLLPCGHLVKASCGPECSDATRCTCLPLPEPVNDTCPVHGDGMEAPDATTNRSTARFDGMEAPDESTCGRCDGTGHGAAGDEYACGACDGSGRYTDPEDDDASRPTFHYTDEDVAQNYEVGKRHGAEAERARIVAIIDDELEAMAEHGAWRSHQKVRDLRKRITGREGEDSAHA